MAYVANTLADDEKDKADQQEALPSLGGATPAANTIGASSSPQPMSGGAPAQQQKTPQQQKGTGFVNLSSWLDAGKGRDKTISNAGATNKAKETENWTTASNTAKTGLAASQPVQVDSVTKQLDREAGILNDGVSGPSLSDVVNQSYKGPTSIDYTAGEGMTNLQNLSKASTAADTLAKPEVEAGRYGAGLRSLDAVLFGADAESQKALAQNATDVTGLKDTATKGAADFEARVGSTIDTMNKNATGVRDELTKIGNDSLAAINKRATEENTNAIRDSQREDMVLDPSTGQYVAVPEGQTLGEWEGSAAGSATAGNVQTDDERKRFDALNKLMGFDAPKAEGQYQAGRRTTKDAPGDITTQKVSQEYQGQFEKGVGNLIDAANTRMGPQGAYNNEVMLGFLSRYTPEQRQEMVSTMINGIMQGRFGDKYASPAAMRHVLQMLTLLGDDKWDQHIKSGRLS